MSVADWASQQSRDSAPQGLKIRPTTAVIDMGYRGVDGDIAPVELNHLGKSKRLTDKH